MATLPDWEVRYLKIMETVAWLATARLLVTYTDLLSVGLTILTCLFFESVRILIESRSNQRMRRALEQEQGDVQ